LDVGVSEVVTEEQIESTLLGQVDAVKRKYEKITSILHP